MFPHRSLLQLPLALALAAVAAAQAAPRANDPAPDVAMSDQILGAPIQSEAGDVLGTVEDVLVDTGTGRMLAVAVAPAASVRADGQLTAVPVEALGDDTAADATAAHRTLHVRRELAGRLSDAPSIARERWNEALDPQWLARLRQHFGVQASDAATPAPERLSALLGSNVVDSSQAAVGRVNAMAVDLARREVTAAIIAPVEELGSRDRMLPVPLGALRAALAPAAPAQPGVRAAAAPADGQRSFSMGLSLDRLLTAPRFDRGDLPRLRALLATKDLREFYAAGAAERRPGTDPQRPATAPQRPATAPQRPGNPRSNSAQPDRSKPASGAARGGGSPH